MKKPKPLLKDVAIWLNLIGAIINLFAFIISGSQIITLNLILLILLSDKKK